MRCWYVPGPKGTGCFILIRAREESLMENSPQLFPDQVSECHEGVPCVTDTIFIENI